MHSCNINCHKLGLSQIWCHLLVIWQLLHFKINSGTWGYKPVPLHLTAPVQQQMYSIGISLCFFFNHFISYIYLSQLLLEKYNSLSCFFPYIAEASYLLKFEQLGRTKQLIHPLSKNVANLLHLTIFCLIFFSMFNDAVEVPFAIPFSSAVCIVM